MWPWDHLAAGYLLVSLWRRYRSGRPPGELEALAILIGTQLPDLVDKPLGWGTTLLPSGHSLAHSLSVAVPLSLVAYLLARWRGRRDVGAAFAIAYLSHLPGDVLYPLVLGRSPNVTFLFWPFVDLSPSQTGPLAGRILELIEQFVGVLHTPRGALFLSLEVTLLVATLVLWWRDGWPGLGAVRRALTPESV